MSRRPALLAVLAGVLVAPAPAPAQDLVDGPIEAALTEPFAYAGPLGRQAIDGPWAVKLDPGTSGQAKGWHTGAFKGRRVSVPYVPNATPLTGEAGVRGFRGNVAWFRTGFRVPTDSEYAIRFESAHHKTRVWLDGRLIARHTGVYLPFERKVELKAGRLYTLVVRTDYRGPTAQKRAGWHRTWFNFGGLNREVTIRPVGASELSAPEITTRLRPDGSASVDVSMHVRNRTGAARRVPVAGVLRRGGEHIDLRFPELVIPAETTRIVHAVAHVPRPALWEPGAPNLYDLEVAVPEESAYRQRVGLRELTWRGSRMFLNGRRLKIHGASLHEDADGRGDALRPADMDALVAQLKAIGANATRSQHQLHPALLERLDAAGIVLWMGLGPVDAPGSWTNKTARQAASGRRRVRETYFQTQAHPSIIAWNLANEVAGNGHPDGQARFIDTMARELHRRDPGRLTAVDVWGAHPPRGGLGRLYRNLDAVAVTNYAGWYEMPLAPRARQAQLIRDTTLSFLRTFRGKVTVISEFGAEANDLNASGRPGGFGYQSALLSRHIETYKAQSRLSGMLVWNLRDFAVSPAFAGGSIRRLVPGIRIIRGINTKGLFDLDGQPKPAVETVRGLYGPLGTGLAPPR